MKIAKKEVKTNKQKTKQKTSIKETDNQLKKLTYINIDKSQNRIETLKLLRIETLKQV